MRLTITGASGLLGLTLTLIAKQQANQVSAFYYRHPIVVPGVQTARLELGEEKVVYDAVQQFRPDWVVHCASATNVDWCEEHPDQARALHVDVARQVAAAAGRAGARLLYVSTDSVFDGGRGEYTEKDPCAPLNVYAATKLAGEAAVLEVLPEALIVRTNMFGWKQRGALSLAEWILQELTDQKSLPGFSDVFFTPLLVNDLSFIMLEMMHRCFHGFYHLAGASATSKYEFARLLARAFGLRTDLIYPIALQQANLRAPRPRNTSLCSDKIVAALGRTMPDVAEAVQRLRILRDSGFLEELKRSQKGINDAKV